MRVDGHDGPMHPSMDGARRSRQPPCRDVEAELTVHMSEQLNPGSILRWIKTYRLAANTKVIICAPRNRGVTDADAPGPQADEGGRPGTPFYARAKLLPGT